MTKLYKYRCPRCGYYLEREELFEYLKAECTYNTDVPIPVKCYLVKQSKINQNENQNPINRTAVKPDRFSTTAKKNQKIDQIARTLTSISLGSTVLDGDTTFHIVYKNAQYPALNDFKGISFQNRVDINAFLWSLLEVVTTGERLDEYTYQNMTATYRIVKGHSNVIIYPEDHAFFYMTQVNIENFIEKLQQY